MRDHWRMHLIKALRDAIGTVVAMLGLLVVAMITFALAVWAAADAVVP